MTDGERAFSGYTFVGTFAFVDYERKVCDFSWLPNNNSSLFSSLNVHRLLNWLAFSLRVRPAVRRAFIPANANPRAVWACVSSQSLPVLKPLPDFQ